MTLEEGLYVCVWLSSSYWGCVVSHSEWNVDDGSTRTVHSKIFVSPRDEKWPMNSRPDGRSFRSYSAREKQRLPVKWITVDWGDTGRVRSLSSTILWYFMFSLGGDDDVGNFLIAGLERSIFRWTQVHVNEYPGTGIFHANLEKKLYF